MAATKKKDWSDLLGGSSKDDQDAPQGPAEPPVTVLMHTIVGNPSNPRPEEDYSDDDPEFRELKASMKEIGQLQPLAVVSRAVFEKAKADTVTQAPAKTRKLIREADWVVVTGNRRLAAARQLGWTRIDIRVQDQLGDEDGRIDEAVIIENIHRKNLAPIKEAEYLAGMLERHGSQEKVAERIGKSQVYVSQRLALLKLAPDIREEVNAGTLRIKEARQLAGQTTDHEEQRARMAALKATATAPKAPRAHTGKPVQNPVLKPDASPASDDPDTDPAQETSQQPSVVQNPVLNDTPFPAAEQAESIPEPRDETTGTERADPPSPCPRCGSGSGPRFPYEDGLFASQCLIHRMPADEFAVMLGKLNEHAARMGLEVNTTSP
jgi:ParB family chromosome partitioning protein